MELCDEIFKSLQMLKDEQIIDYDGLKNLINLVCNLLNGSNEKNNEEFKRLDHNQQKLSIGIYCLYLETCRLNTSSESELNELESVLDHVEMLEKNKKLIINSFKNINQDNQHLGNRNNELPIKIKDKLLTLELNSNQQFIEKFKAIELIKDSVMKSSRKTNYNHICQIEYLASIKTHNTEHLFTCSIQDIEDLERKFNEIMKSIDQLFTVIEK